eukprot:scaffold73362_cov36-Phaeocystis_antarctica.AAC.1
MPGAVWGSPVAAVAGLCRDQGRYSLGASAEHAVDWPRLAVSLRAASGVIWRWKRPPESQLAEA